jgi:hypothetical protein
MKLRRVIICMGPLLLAFGTTALAGVLPEDRADVMYHLYDGGGVKIDGPSILIRKQASKNISVVANYYVDMVSSASIDVITTASPYTEERTQWSVGMDYLYANTTVRANYTSSSESDFDAETFAFAVSQDMFGDMTTLTLSFTVAADAVGRSDDPTFGRDISRQQYGIGITQILTKNLIAAVNFETITDEGFLSNPYRSVRYLDFGSAIGYSFEPELYPNTRTSNALGLRARYYLPYRAAVEGEYRFYTDTWNITGHTFALTYVHPMGPWTFTAKYRYHDQSGADFFNDLFPRSEATNFRGRDKELSPLTSQTLKLAASYEFISDADSQGFIKRGTVNMSLDVLTIDYDEFRDLTSGASAGFEPLYALDADVVQLFFSFWY